MTLETSISEIIDQAIANRVFPGAVVLVARAGEINHHVAYGSTMYDAPESSPVTTDTIYDVASLTKMFTATAALQQVDAGWIALDAPVQDYLPRFHHPDVTIWHLFTHTSGLDIRLSALRELGSHGMLEAVYATASQHPPGSVVAYTNVNSLLLGEVITHVTNHPLDRILAESILQPLGLHDTQFCPPESLYHRIAPTEIDAAWRGGLVHGTVHDESTHALGGVAGHAGLFSTATDLLVFCQSWLDALRQGDKETRRQGANDLSVSPSPLFPFSPFPLLRSETACRATTNQTPALNAACGLGWMIDRPNFMGFAPNGSFGHTGFTGPAMVVIPEHETIVVVLCNRVYPQRGPSTHHAVIAAIVEAALS